jgi:hypothetical protein
MKFECRDAFVFLACIDGCVQEHVQNVNVPNYSFASLVRTCLVFCLCVPVSFCTQFTCYSFCCVKKQVPRNSAGSSSASSSVVLFFRHFQIYGYIYIYCYSAYCDQSSSGAPQSLPVPKSLNSFSTLVRFFVRKFVLGLSERVYSW